MNCSSDTLILSAASLRCLSSSCSALTLSLSAARFFSEKPGFSFTFCDGLSEGGSEAIVGSDS